MPAPIPLLASLLLTAVLLLGARPAPAAGQEQLEALGALVAGEWETADSRHVFEWGVGRRVLRSRSYFSEGGGWRLVSEGQWFWDAQAGVIRGTVLADGMPFHRMEYRARVDGDRVVHRLRTFGPATPEYVETWTFTGNEYRWQLEEATETGREPVMSGVYRRVDTSGPP